MDWDKRYQLGDTPWEKGQAHPFLKDLIARGDFGFWSDLEQQVLLPGCGFGHDVAELSSAGIKAFGVDIAPAAIEQARTLYPENEFVLGDLLNPQQNEWGQNLTGLFEHTCFCALNPSLRESYISAASRLLPEGAHLAGIFFINPEMSRGESGPPFGTSLDELEQMFSKHFQILVSEVPSKTYSGREGRERYILMRRLAS